jgi:uncharacterized repeat protein (TIGR04042 family)
MPVMHFNIRWPDDSRMRCYSPSLVVRDYFEPGTSYPLESFIARSREALNIASDRVAARYGFACSAAMDQLAQIEATARRFDGHPSPVVAVESFD